MNPNHLKNAVSKSTAILPVLVEIIWQYLDYSPNTKDGIRYLCEELSNPYIQLSCHYKDCSIKYRNTQLNKTFRKRMLHFPDVIFKRIRKRATELCIMHPIVKIKPYKIEDIATLQLQTKDLVTFLHFAEEILEVFHRMDFSIKMHKKYFWDEWIDEQTVSRTITLIERDITWINSILYSSMVSKN